MDMNEAMWLDILGNAVPRKRYPPRKPSTSTCQLRERVENLRGRVEKVEELFDEVKELKREVEKLMKWIVATANKVHQIQEQP